MGVGEFMPSVDIGIDCVGESVIIFQNDRCHLPNIAVWCKYNVNFIQNNQPIKG